ncbi:hypothetical protein H6501_03235 [Candidatus Woesearchaeota archaeon]|nr:hypothetical protein [Candidatus Woesearchaeota archaeon]USN43666.1 MAG: hypothetical protein H6500_04720 [Candidatus Woesearchaeota archaeon]
MKKNYKTFLFLILLLFLCVPITATAQIPLFTTQILTISSFEAPLLVQKAEEKNFTKRSSFYQSCQYSSQTKNLECYEYSMKEVEEMPSKEKITYTIKSLYSQR